MFWDHKSFLQLSKVLELNLCRDNLKQNSCGSSLLVGFQLFVISIISLCYMVTIIILKVCRKYLPHCKWVLQQQLSTILPLSHARTLTGSSQYFTTDRGFLGFPLLYQHQLLLDFIYVPLQEDPSHHQWCMNRQYCSPRH